MTKKWLAAFLVWIGLAFVSTSAGAQSVSQASLDTWRAPAKLCMSVGKKRGEITIGTRGIEFRSQSKGQFLRWSTLDIRTFYLSAHRLVIVTYQDRKHHLPGERRYRFEIAHAIPARVALALAQSVGRPSQNAVPNPASPDIASLTAHHRTRTGGTNGTLRFLKSGIEYVASSSRDSRSWRWADIQTIAQPSSYRFTLGGYLETYDFDLKEPMSDVLFDRLWDAVYGRGLMLSPGNAKPERIKQPRPSVGHQFSAVH